MSWAWLAPYIARLIHHSSRFDAIWSTYPIASAHRIGAKITSATKLPWVADFRDPMLQEDYPSDPTLRQAFQQIETNVANQAAALVFTTPSARDEYARRFGSIDGSKFLVIENGYEESLLEQARDKQRKEAIANDPRMVLLHSGFVYADERDPSRLFLVLSDLKRTGQISKDNFVLRFRASGSDRLLSELATRHAVEDLIEIEPPLNHLQAVQEMLAVDALLILQAANCNAQIPAKIYEYFATGKPIIGLTDPSGDTGRLMLNAGYKHIAALESQQAIDAALTRFITDVRRNNAFGMTADKASQYSRRRGASLLGESLSKVATN